MSSKSEHRAALWLVACSLALTTARSAADSGNLRSFGSVDGTPIVWEEPQNVELTNDALRLTRPGSVVRSQPLPLRPLQYYRINTRMARGPGSSPQFSIVYLDARGKTIEWLPSWQLKGSARPGWLPLSPGSQRYVQGFVLPLGAAQPRLQLRLGASDRGLEPYSRWEISELQLQATGKTLPRCEQLGEDRLLGGDFEGAPHDGLPAWWAQWLGKGHHRVETVASDATRKHVLCTKPSSRTLLASTYLVPVTPGSAYRVTLMARGHGRVELDVHSLSHDKPTALRVGNATRGTGGFEVNTDHWAQLSQVWFAEAPNIASAQVVIDINADRAVEIDAVELRPCL